MDEIIIAPCGMKRDLARKLVEDDAFAHMWLVHGDGGECPDGCDLHGNPVRVKLYEEIRVYHTRRDIEAYRRGQSDSHRDRAPIFRKVGKSIQPELDDPNADDWEDSERQAYLDGYHS